MPDSGPKVSRLWYPAFLTIEQTVLGMVCTQILVRQRMHELPMSQMWPYLVKEAGLDPRRTPGTV